MANRGGKKKKRFILTYLFKEHCTSAQVALVVKNLPANAGDRYKKHALDPWVGKIPWRRAWQPLQYSCLQNPMDRGAWWATVHGVAKLGTTEVA